MVLMSGRNSPELTVSHVRFSLWFPTVRAEGASEPVVEKSKAATYVPLPGETGWDRVKAMYSTSIYGDLGPEWTAIKHCTTMGGVSGAVYGALVGAKYARVKYLEKNEATLYSNEMAARRALQDKITLGMVSGGFKWGWRTALFTGMYVYMVTHMSVYFNQTHLINFIIAGAVSGGLWRFLQGPKASAVAAGLGATLGLMAGGVSMAVFHATGTSLEEMRFYHYQVYSKRQSELAIDKAQKKNSQANKTV